MCSWPQEPTVLSLFVSCMAKLFNLVRDDITDEIFSEYLTLWPTALGRWALGCGSGFKKIKIDPCRFDMQCSWALAHSSSEWLAVVDLDFLFCYREQGRVGDPHGWKCLCVALQQQAERPGCDWVDWVGHGARLIAQPSLLVLASYESWPSLR